MIKHWLFQNIYLAQVFVVVITDHLTVFACLFIASPLSEETLSVVHTFCLVTSNVQLFTGLKDLHERYSVIPAASWIVS